MALSAEFKALKARVATLRKQFLPLQFSPTGAYTNEELDNARAFRILVHADLENYFEKRALDVAIQAFALFQTKSKATVTLACLLSNGLGEKNRLPRALGTNISAHSISGRALGQYRHTVNNNHGVRATNLLEILLPVGIMEADIDSAWLATTDGFGAKRGLTAHSSAIYNTIDPRDDFNTVTQIMAGVSDLDLALNKIWRTIR
jgi:hypothetical protein